MFQISDSLEQQKLVFCVPQVHTHTHRQILSFIIIDQRVGPASLGQYPLNSNSKWSQNLNSKCYSEYRFLNLFSNFFRKTNSNISKFFNFELERQFQHLKIRIISNSSNSNWNVQFTIFRKPNSNVHFTSFIKSHSDFF